MHFLYPPPYACPSPRTYKSPFLACLQSAFIASAALFVNLVYTLSTCGITNSSPAQYLYSAPPATHADHLSTSLTTGREAAAATTTTGCPINMLLKHVPVVSRQALSTPECLLLPPPARCLLPMRMWMPIPIPSPSALLPVAMLRL